MCDSNGNGELRPCETDWIFQILFRDTGLCSHRPPTFKKVTAMRIQLPKNFIKYNEIANWMNENIGPIEEGVTWFWSCGDPYSTVDCHGNTIWKDGGEGIKIWKESPIQVFAAIKWG